MATEQISIQADISESINFLEKLGADRKKTLRRILSGVGSDARNKAKKAYKSSGLNQRSGTLYRSISRKIVSRGQAVMIEAKAQNEKNIFYGYALTKGSKITAPEGKSLSFQINGKWIKAKSVQLKAHDFIEQPVKRYLDSNAFKVKVDKLVDKEIARIEKETAK